MVGVPRHSLTRWIGICEHFYLNGCLLTNRPFSRPGAANPWKTQIRSKFRIPSFRCPWASLRVSFILYTGGLCTTRARKGQFLSFVCVLLAASSTTPRNEVVISQAIPESVMGLTKAKRNKLVEQLAEIDEEIGELFLNDELLIND
jgi:elongation factor G